LSKLGSILVTRYISKLALSILLISPASAQDPISFSIDHVSIVVEDLKKAVSTFEQPGFSVKQGRKHNNTIENAHVKFSNGSSIELITATETHDPLASTYLEEKQNGEGPVFLSLGMKDPELTMRLLSGFSPKHTEGGYYHWITFPQNSALSYLFLINYKQSPIDKYDHLTHRNSSKGILKIILKKDLFLREKKLFSALGVYAKTDEFSFSNGTIDLDRSKSNARPISSITVAVDNIEKVRDYLVGAIPFRMFKNSIIISKENCHGLELVFVESPP